MASAKKTDRRAAPELSTATSATDFDPAEDSPFYEEPDPPPKEVSDTLLKINDIREFALGYDSTPAGRARRRALKTITLIIEAPPFGKQDPNDSSETDDDKYHKARTLKLTIEEMVGTLFETLAGWDRASDRPKDGDNRHVLLSLKVHIRGQDIHESGRRRRAIVCNFTGLPTLSVVGSLMAEPEPDRVRLEDAYLSPVSVMSLFGRTRGIHTLKIDLNLDRYEPLTLMDACSAMNTLFARVKDPDFHALQTLELFSTDALFLCNKYVPVAEEAGDCTIMHFWELTNEIVYVSKAAPNLETLILKDVCEVSEFLLEADSHVRSLWNKLKTLVVTGVCDGYINPSTHPEQARTGFETITRLIDLMPRLEYFHLNMLVFPDKPLTGPIPADERDVWMGKYEMFEVKLELSGEPGNPEQTSARRREAVQRFYADQAHDADTRTRADFTMTAHGIFNETVDETLTKPLDSRLSRPWAELVRSRDVKRGQVTWRNDLRMDMLPGQRHQIRGYWRYADVEDLECIRVATKFISTRQEESSIRSKLDHGWHSLWC